MDAESSDTNDTQEEAVEQVFESKAEAPVENPKLTYEEKPVINPQTGEMTEKIPHQPELLEQPKALPVMKPPTAKRSFGSILLQILLFLILFGTGIWASTVLRNYLPNGIGTFLSRETTDESVFETPAPTESEKGPFDGWETYEIPDGEGGLPLVGISFMLPPDVLSPICDSLRCVSQGTYLPGGTRFTVAPRGAGHALADFRGKIVSDAAGREFLPEEVTVASRSAVSFRGDFVGSTVSGYSFTKMRGVMIEVSETLSLEFNHFAPTGVNADFATDDALLEEILQTLVLPVSSIFPTPSTEPQY